MTPTGGGACISDGCNANVAGFFAGADAARAGISYSITDFGDQFREVIGAAAFKKD
ncbi:hypothetical protein D3C83_141460 [compost metagenome]